MGQVRLADEAVRRPDGSLFEIEGSQVRFTPTSCTGPADPTKQISDPCPTDSSTRRMFSYGRPNGQRVHGRKPPRSKASLCQEVPSVLFAACEVPFGRCAFTREPWPLAVLAAEYGRRLAAPPGRSSSLRCGRSTWTCGVAGGRVATIEEWPALPGAPAGPGA